MRGCRELGGREGHLPGLMHCAVRCWSAADNLLMRKTETLLCATNNGMKPPSA